MLVHLPSSEDMFRFLPLLSAALLLASVLFVPCRTHAAAPPEGMPITLGTKSTLRSSLLEEERGFLVYLPPGYASSAERYPVLYLLDGDAHFHHATGVVQFLANNSHIPQLIVVGVSNTDRTRDLTPPAHADARFPGDASHRSVAQVLPNAGGAERFLRFLEEELAPLIEARYRTRPYRILVGHSYGGLLAVHALMSRPQGFHAYIAISPSLWWNNGELVSRAAKALERLPPQERFLYMSMGNEGEGMVGPLQRFVKVLDQARPARLVWRYSFLENDHHASTPHRTLYDGLETLFADMRISESMMRSGDLAKVEANYARLTKRLGFELHPPEDTLNAMGYQLLGSGKAASAIAVFRRNAEWYSGSANVHDSLGEALEAAGQLEAARESYKRAIALGLESGHAHPAFQQNLDRVSRKLAPAAKPASAPPK